jgi:peptidoglycan hydrolase-like protein with peptidoglycan-binding domain
MVAQLQRALREAGHQVRVNGDYDKLTRRAVASVQMAAGLSVTGSCDEGTLNALGSQAQERAEAEKRAENRAKQSATKKQATKKQATKKASAKKPAKKASSKSKG